MNFLYQTVSASVNSIVEIKVRSSMNSLCSVELSCINNILISDQCIPGNRVFYNSWENVFFLHSWSNNQLSFGILRKILMLRAGDYEQIIITMNGLKMTCFANVARTTASTSKFLHQERFQIIRNWVFICKIIFNVEWIKN